MFKSVLLGSEMCSTSVLREIY